MGRDEGDLRAAPPRQQRLWGMCQGTRAPGLVGEHVLVQRHSTRRTSHTGRRRPLDPCSPEKRLQGIILGQALLAQSHPNQWCGEVIAAAEAKTRRDPEEGVPVLYLPELPHLPTSRSSVTGNLYGVPVEGTKARDV